MGYGAHPPTARALLIHVHVLLLATPFTGELDSELDPPTARALRMHVHVHVMLLLLTAGLWSPPSYRTGPTNTCTFTATATCDPHLRVAYM